MQVSFKNTSRLLFGSCTLIALASCSMTPSAVDKDKTATDSAMQTLSKTQPIPVITTSRTRQTLIDALKAKAAANSTWTVERSASGVLLRIIPSIGYAVPADAQLTNPLQVICQYTSSSGCGTVEQAEADGTYTSKNTNATIVVEVLPDGKRVLFTSENQLSTYAYPVEERNGRVVSAGNPPEAAVLKK